MNNGRSMESCSAAYSLKLMPVTNRFGSKLGLLTMANTSPVDGSSATTEPRRSPNASSAASCSFTSRLRTMFLPGIGSVCLSTRSTRPWALVSTSS
ncbi:hypothetical protein D3C87_1704740 [compost metagenome]